MRIKGRSTDQNQEKLSEFLRENQELKSKLAREKHNLEELREKENLYRLLTDNIPDVIWTMDLNLRVKYLSPSITQLTGYSVREALSLSLKKILSSLSIQAIGKSLDLEIDKAGEEEIDVTKLTPQAEAPFTLEAELIRKNGTTIWTESTITLLFDTEKKPFGILGVTRNIAIRRRDKEALEASKERLETLFEYAPDAFFLHDPEGTVIYINNTAEKLTGHTKDEVIGMSITKLGITSQSNLSPKFPSSGEMIDSKQITISEEVTLNRKDGKRIPVELRTFPTSIGGKTVLIGIFRDISGRKRAEQALRESEQRHRLLAENVTDTILAMDIYLRFTYVSPSITTLLGYLVDEAMSKTLEEILTPESFGIATDVFQEEFTFDQQRDPLRSKTLELELIHKHGGTVWVEFKLSMLRDPANRPVGILGVFRDITERKKMEGDLKTSEEKMRIIFESTADGIYVFTLDGTVIQTNKSALRLGEFTRKDEIIGKIFFDFISPEDQERVMENLPGNVAGQDQSRTFECRLLKNNGDTYDAELDITLLRDEYGNPAGFVSTVRDITERKLVEEAIRESEQRYRLLAENATDIILAMDVYLQIIYVNPSIQKALGYSVDEAISKTLEELLTPDSFHLLTETFKEEFTLDAQRDPQRSRAMEVELIHKNGKTIWSEMILSLLRDSENRPIGILGVARDITERKRTEEILIKSASEWRRTFDTMPDAVMLLDRNYKITRVNKAAARIIGLPFQEIVGLSCFQCIHASDAPMEYCPHARTIADGKEHSVEIYDEERDRYFFITTSPLEDRSGSVHIMHDITERKQAEEALRKASLETLQTMSQLVEVNDPYTAGHSKRVTELAVEIAREMGLDSGQLETLRIAGYLHDLGKVGIPGTVLNKPSRLTRSEWVMIRHHPEISAQASRNVAAFKDAVPVIRFHHESWDGSGYPDGIKGEEIPLLARILAVADTYDAMTSERPYRKALTNQQAIEELVNCSGSRLDPHVVQVFIDMLGSSNNK